MAKQQAEDEPADEPAGMDLVHLLREVTVRLDRTIALLATFEAEEQAAIRRFLSGVGEAVTEEGA
ncbi:hypothetical protein OG229_12275 [Streptomyces platensis]|uniref:hypothetical protein n=1 Tax=Streptomyces platensis TaxID=58346 RepID=UPI002E0E0CF3|nr:hypothetical protein OG229_12275 [Streptomyces platensis]